MKNENDNWVYNYYCLSQFIMYNFFRLLYCASIFFSIVCASFIQFFERYYVHSNDHYVHNDHFHYAFLLPPTSTFSFTVPFFFFFFSIFSPTSSSFFLPFPSFFLLLPPLLLPFPLLPSPSALPPSSSFSFHDLPPPSSSFCPSPSPFFLLPLRGLPSSPRPLGKSFFYSSIGFFFVLPFFFFLQVAIDCF